MSGFWRDLKSRFWRKAAAELRGRFSSLLAKGTTR